MASRKYGPKRYSAKSHLMTVEHVEIHEYVRAKSAADARAQVTGGAQFCLGIGAAIGALGMYFLKGRR